MLKWLIIKKENGRDYLVALDEIEVAAANAVAKDGSNPPRIPAPLKEKYFISPVGAAHVALHLGTELFEVLPEISSNGNSGIEVLQAVAHKLYTNSTPALNIPRKVS